LRAVLQRVASASVSVDGAMIASIERGLLVLLGVAHGDDGDVARRLAEKCAELRIFPDGDNRFDRSLAEAGGAALVVPQFTLLADTRRGRRPSFADAAPPDVAAPLVDAFAAALRARGIDVQSGRFGAMMQVALVNDGPVTLLLDSADFERPRRA
jgi:D-tyrosyl-tRNA(Tyr) deacylase